MSFQPKQTPNPTPFLTPFEHILNLKTNTPPLTRFLIDTKREKTYKRHNTLITQLKTALRAEKLCIVSCDKGPGLLLIATNTLQSTYREYLENNSFITSTSDIKHALSRLVHTLLEVDPRAYLVNTDDRVPNLYFKIKTHKEAFITTTTTTRFSEIYSYNLGPKSLAKIARPIVNHKTSITCLTSQYLRKFITPIIEASPYLTADIFDTMDRLCRLGRPEHIYTGDIEAFYPSTPHILVLEAFRYYQPHRHLEYELLTALLKFNFVTDGENFYDIVSKGIPMGLQLAPEIARMATAFLLRNYEQPAGHTLTIYFDDVSATYHILDLPLEPFILKETPDNRTQDAKCDTDSKQFTPYTQAFRQCVPLHPHLHHPSKKLVEKTFHGSAFRATQMGTNPADTLKYLIAKYVPALYRLGHVPNEVITNLTNISYFPTKTNKESVPFLPNISYAFSDTRPTTQQLRPIAKQEFRLIPKIPLAPLKGLLAYNPPNRTNGHNIYTCNDLHCVNCTNYTPKIKAKIAVPVTPCTRMRCLYILHHKHSCDPPHFYISHTNLTKGPLATTGKFNRLALHLAKDEIAWEILALFPATYTLPINGKTDKEAYWVRQIKEHHEGCIIHTTSTLKQFYAKEKPQEP